MPSWADHFQEGSLLHDCVPFTKIVERCLKLPTSSRGSELRSKACWAIGSWPSAKMRSGTVLWRPGSGNQRCRYHDSSRQRENRWGLSQCIHVRAETQVVGLFQADYIPSFPRPVLVWGGIPAKPLCLVSSLYPLYANLGSSPQQCSARQFSRTSRRSTFSQRGQRTMQHGQFLGFVQRTIIWQIKTRSRNCREIEPPDCGVANASPVT